MSRIESLDCESFEDRIQQILDDRLTLTGDDLLMTHASRCAECNKILSEYDSLDDSVKLLPADLAQILATTDSKVDSTQWSSRRLSLLISLAAAIVISLNVFHAFDERVADHASNKVKSPTANAPVSLQSPVESHGASRNSLQIHEPLEPPQRLTLDSSPFSKNFSLISWHPTSYVPTIPTLEEISFTLNEFESILIYSSRIPGAQPLQSSLSITLDWLKQSISQPDRTPDLGFWFDSNMLAAV